MIHSVRCQQSWKQKQIIFIIQFSYKFDGELLVPSGEMKLGRGNLLDIFDIQQLSKCLQDSDFLLSVGAGFRIQTWIFTLLGGCMTAPSQPLCFPFCKDFHHGGDWAATYSQRWLCLSRILELLYKYLWNKCLLLPIH